MKMPKKWERLLFVGLGVLALVLAARYLLPCLAPFLAAMALAAALERPVNWLRRRGKLPRSVASGACVLSAVGLLGWGLYALCARILTELKGLVQRLPELLENFSVTLLLWRDRLVELLPGDFSGARVLEGIQEWLMSLPGLLSGRLLTLVTAAAGAAPAVLLFAVTTVIGAYFISASYGQILHFAQAQMSEPARKRAGELWKMLQNTIVRYCRAQLILMLITFGELLLAFALLGVDYAVLLAMATAVIDALPVLGAGTVLIPWAAYELLSGRIRRGIGLAVAYGVVTVLRSCIQAKLLGDQLGLHPLVTLLAIYVGYRLWGVMGMIVFPIAAILIQQLNDGGVIALWKPIDKGDKHDRNYDEYYRRRRHERSRRHEYPSR